MKSSFQLLVFCLEDRLYGVRLGQIDRVIRAVEVTPLPEAPNVIIGIIDLQGEIVPVLNIRRRFGFADREIGVDDQFIVATTSKRRVVLAVDRVMEVIERPADDVVAASRIVEGLDQIEGVIQLKDGLTLIHDLERFLTSDEELALALALTTEMAHAQ